MKDVLIVDTCILTNLLKVPGKCQKSDEVIKEFASLVEGRRAELVIPISALIETGNHIGQLSDGRVRRTLSKTLYDFVALGISGTQPWVPAPEIRREELERWWKLWEPLVLEEVGLGDVAILDTYNQQLELHKPLGRRVFIWSIDSDFRGRALVVTRPSLIEMA